jgi:hypothetical protein
MMRSTASVAARVKAGGRFVEQQQARLHGPGAGQGQTLAFAAGKQTGAVLGAVRQADPFQHVIAARPPLGGVHRLRPQANSTLVKTDMRSSMGC